MFGIRLVEPVITVLLLAILVAPATTAAHLKVALTFDDLPTAGAKDDAEADNAQILHALKEHNAVATGFVIEKVGRELSPAVFQRILRQWIAGGHRLGNHSFSHADYNTISVERFRTELQGGEVTFRPLLPAERGIPLYFRFPYNHMGELKNKLNAARAVLVQRGYQVAACTIDNSDYEFARAYDAMRRRKGAEQDRAKLRRVYLDYTSEEIDYYTALHRKVFGRDVPHVMLLHVNRLNADTLPQILSSFIGKGFQFVSLTDAQSDPAYQTAITEPTRFGPMWGYRWAQALGVRIDGRDEPQPPAWVLSYGK